MCHEESSPWKHKTQRGEIVWWWGQSQSQDERSVAGSWRYYRCSTHRTDYVIRAPFSHTILSSAASYIVRSHCQSSSVCLASKVSGECSFRVKLPRGSYCRRTVPINPWDSLIMTVVLVISGLTADLIQLRENRGRKSLNHYKA